MAKGKLRHGYTTGSCAAAAAKGAVIALLGRSEDTVALTLPWGSEDAKEVPFALVNPEGQEGMCSFGVIKDGGDDPDATDGMEIRATAELLDIEPGVSRIDHSEPTGYPHTEVEETVSVTIDGGFGIGRVTREGLAAKVGEAAINPVPRQMIKRAVLEGVAEAGYKDPVALRITITAPEGEERAKKTMNARLGILGGISILGTTGIVVPMSTSAWTATIDSCLDVAKADGASRALLAFGRTSERAGQAHFSDLAGNAAVLMGDHIGYSLDAAVKRDMDVVIAGQFAKFCKVASGFFATHVKDSTLNLSIVERLMVEAGFGVEESREAASANTARETFQKLIKMGDDRLFHLLTEVVAKNSSERAGGKIAVKAVLFGYKGEKISSFSIERGDRG